MYNPNLTSLSLALKKIEFVNICTYQNAFLRLDIFIIRIKKIV